jgi:hypothetical protein
LVYVSILIKRYNAGKGHRSMEILFLRGVYGEVCEGQDSDVSGFLFCVFVIMTELDKLMANSATTFEFRFYSEQCGRRTIEHLLTAFCWYIYKEV